MNAFTEYLEFIQRFNPDHEFTDKELNFLREDFDDLKTFVEELDGKKSDRKEVNFEDVLKDEIFYYDNTTYVKINNNEGQEFRGPGIKQFLGLTSVEIKSST